MRQLILHDVPKVTATPEPMVVEPEPEPEAEIEPETEQRPRTPTEDELIAKTWHEANEWKKHPFRRSPA